MSAHTIPGRNGATGNASATGSAGRNPVLAPGAVGGSATSAPARSGVGAVAIAQPDEHLLVSGYLAAVAACLHQRGVVVGEVFAGEAGANPLYGGIALDPPERDGRWRPTRLDWREDSGWSATLLPCRRDGGYEPAAPRYLPRQLVPAPDTVAHFVAALNADPETVWARHSFDQPRRIDRRLLILELSRFGIPDPS